MSIHKQQRCTHTCVDPSIVATLQLLFNTVVVLVGSGLNAHRTDNNRHSQQATSCTGIYRHAVGPLSADKVHTALSNEPHAFAAITGTRC